MMASFLNGCILYEYNVPTTIEGWDLVYWEVGKSKVVSEFGLSEIL